jgi:hypothetical protein
MYLFSAKMSSKPYYPFGKDGNVECQGCCKTYPISGGRDLQFDGQHALFGIRECTNVLSGATYDLKGKRFDPPLKELTDEVLNEWYFHHYNREDDEPFGYDIANPFAFPYIKYRSAKKELTAPSSVVDSTNKEAPMQRQTEEGDMTPLHHDDPTKIDRLGRKPFAKALAIRLRRVKEQNEKGKRFLFTFMDRGDQERLRCSIFWKKNL